MPRNPTSIDNFFSTFGKLDTSQSLHLSENYSPEENARLLAAHYDNTTEPRQGLFYDFSNTPELEKPILKILINRYNWNKENPFFIRKPELKPFLK